MGSWRAWTTSRTVLGVSLLGVIAPFAINGCSPDCTKIGYLATVSVELPQSMIDGHTFVRLCVQDQCLDLGSNSGLPSITLSGALLTFSVDDGVLDADVVAVRLISTGAVVADSTLRTRPHTDHHGGCADSNFIRLRYDVGTGQLVKA